MEPQNSVGVCLAPYLTAKRTLTIWLMTARSELIDCFILIHDCISPRTLTGTYSAAKIYSCANKQRRLADSMQHLKHEMNPKGLRFICHIRIHSMREKGLRVIWSLRMWSGSTRLCADTCWNSSHALPAGSYADSMRQVTAHVVLVYIAVD